jgi:anti-sigma-K factor RskA
VSANDHRPPGGGTADPRDDLVAYSTDATDADEQRAGEAVVPADLALAADVQARRDTTGELGAAVAEDPPPRPGQAALDAAAQMPQQATAARDRMPQEVRPEPSSEPTRGTRPPSRLRTQALAGLAAAATVAALTAGTLAWRTNQENEELAARQAVVVEVLSAPDASATSRDVIGGGRGTVVSSAEQGQSIFVASDLRARPESQTYQLWLIGPAGAASAGLVDPAGGDVTRLLDTPAGEVTQIGLSVEPAGGSPHPTNPVLLVAIT